MWCCATKFVTVVIQILSQFLDLSFYSFKAMHYVTNTLKFRIYIKKMVTPKRYPTSLPSNLHRNV